MMTDYEEGVQQQETVAKVETMEVKLGRALRFSETRKPNYKEFSEAYQFATSGKHYEFYRVFRFMIAQLSLCTESFELTL